jgi:multidrug resistance efflux pump
MSGTKQATDAPRGRISWAVWLGGILLAASGIGAGLGLHSRADNEPPPSSSSKGERWTGFGHVDVLNGVTPLYPAVPAGRVAEILVTEGKQVEPDEVLYRLDDKVAREQVEEAKADLEGAEIKLEAARDLVEQHKAQVEGLKSAVEAAKAAAEAAQAASDEAQRQLKNQNISEEKAKAAKALVQQAEKTVKAKESELRAAEAQNPSRAVAGAEAAVTAKRAQLRKAEKALKDYTVTAPAKGTILQMNLTVGEIVSPSLAAATRRVPLTFVPDGPRIIRAEMEQEFAHRVAMGQKATVQDDSTASGTWKGKVVHISDWFTHRRSMLLEPFQLNDVRTLECIIELDPGQPHLRIGQRMIVQLDGGGN